MLNRLSNIRWVIISGVHLERFAVLINHAWNDLINGKAFILLKSIKEYAILELLLNILILEKLVI